MNNTVWVLNEGICNCCFWCLLEGRFSGGWQIWEGFLDNLLWEKKRCFILKLIFCTNNKLSNKLWSDWFWGKLSYFCFKIKLIFSLQQSHLCSEMSYKNTELSVRLPAYHRTKYQMMKLLWENCIPDFVFL